jgi:Uma2 family endonuclease
MGQEASMGSPQLKHHGYTIGEWATWEGSWELLNGEAYAMAPPTLEHQRVSFRLSRDLANGLDAAKPRFGGGECEVFPAPCGLFLPGESALQPDLMVVCDPAMKSGRGIEGAPDLVVEILSPSTTRIDLLDKRRIYERALVPEYLIVDPDRKEGILLRLEGAHYEEAARIPWGGLLPLLGGRLPIALGSAAEAKEAG